MSNDTPEPGDPGTEQRQKVEAPTDADASTVSAPGGAAGKGLRIGPYRLLRKIGEGGMGEVWEAEQEEPLRRSVALKLIKVGMDTKQVVARFESERQALAIMDHPNVAKVFDGGATDAGRPYFVMEYVRGEPITDYCDKHRLPMRERLELFVQACEGVQHAHQKAIIHRDIKPSNVLVTIQGAKPITKIIDFGVAKATAQRLTEKTLFTEVGALIGTPEYMSPEQAEMTGLDVDTRTDVYSLGVLLYELIVGALPFESRELRQAGFDEIRRKIREDEPSKPSARLSTLDGERAMESAKRRRTDLSNLRRQLAGELDWITMKALEKDRARRYMTPIELAVDIQRHLTDQPVVAGPPAATYRARKFVRRHRTGVVVTTVGVMLVLGLAVRERIQANRIADALDQAEIENEIATQVSDFLVGLFSVSDPNQARGEAVTAREILDLGASEIEETLADQPEIQTRLMATMGAVYLNLGQYEQAEPLLEQAVETEERTLGRDHREALRSKSYLAVLNWRQGRYDEAEPLFLEALAGQRRVLGDDHPHTVHTMTNLAILYSELRRYDRGEKLWGEILEIHKRVFGDDHPETVGVMHNLALVYHDQGRFDEAEPLFLETVAIRKRTLGDDHPNTLGSVAGLAYLYGSQSRYDEAEPLFLETLETQKRVLGGDHPKTLGTMNNLAMVYASQGRLNEAESLYLETLAGKRRALDDDHPSVGATIHNLAVVYRDKEQFDEAQSYFERAQRIFETKLGADHTYVGENLEEWAVLLRRVGDDAAASRMDARARAIRDR